MKKATIAGLTTVAFTAPGMSDPVPIEKAKKNTAPATTDMIRTGYIGVGNKGQGHLRTCVGLSNIEIVSIGDVSDRSLFAAKKIISGSNLPEPKVYTGNDFAYLEMLEKEDLDLQQRQED
jgi:predicted homoserine dehydrogenase-like protein